MGVLTDVIKRSNVVDTVKEGAKIRQQSSLMRQRQRQYDTVNSIAQQKLDLVKNKSSVLDSAIKVYNKKLDVVSRYNQKAAEFGSDQMPMPTLQSVLAEDFGIGEPSSPSLSTPAPMSPSLGMARNIARSNIPTENRGPRLDANIRQVLDSMPRPKKIVHDKLPNIQSLIQTLNDYERPEDAIRDLNALDDQYSAMGLDLAEVEDESQFQNAFRAKFGDAALQELLRQLAMKRGS